MVLFSLHAYSKDGRQVLSGVKNPNPWDTLVITDGLGSDVLAIQRRLRTQLIDNSTIRYKPARDLAAHMLLHLDDLSACWSLATNWLRAGIGCQRVDAGFGVPQNRQYFPSYAEAKDSNFDVPTLGGSAVDNHDAAMQAMWHSPHPVIFADIKQDSRVHTRLRERLSKARTKTKIAGALRVGGNAYGLICADWTEHLAPADSNIYDCFEQTVADVLSPIIEVSKAIYDADRLRQRGYALCGDPNIPHDVNANNVTSARLTSSEVEVAKLIAKGLSYKDIALIRGRSLSTIDHQLRSIRRKAGVTSTSALISLLAKIKF